MKFQAPLENAKLIKRYKRFLADVELASGEETTIHCPNTGSMKNCAEPGFGVWYSTSENKKRKYPYTWELAVTSAGHFIGINTNNANKLVKEALQAKRIQELANYSETQSEVKYGEENSRIDFLLKEAVYPDCYVEVKSVTLLENGRGLFPDAVSTRGQKHLRELAHAAESGHRAVLLFCVQHTGIETVSVADQIDPDYAAAMQDALTRGVEVLVYGCEISAEKIELTHRLEFLSGAS